MIKRSILALAMILSTSALAYGTQNFSYTSQEAPSYTPENYAQENYKIDAQTLKGSVITVPAGQTFKGVFMAPVSSETAYTGQEITLALSSDFYYNGKMIAPAGSSIIGTVIEVATAKHGSLNGKLSLRFTKIITPNGQTIPISAIIKTDDNTGILLGGTKMDTTKEYAKDLAIGAGAGALIGTIAAPLSGGSVGRGAALMTAVGAGGGLVKSIWDKGTEVSIPVNASIDLILTQPITVNPTSI